MSNYDQIGRWRFQIDRSKIFDGFEQGDLPRLFDESRVKQSFGRRRKEPVIR